MEALADRHASSTVAVRSRVHRILARLRAALESQGITVSGIGQVTPSLEDVFLDVVERTEQAAQGGQAA